MTTPLDRLHAAVLKTWGYDTLRPLQAEAMQSVVEGRDSLVVLPTGGGKSLCFQAPALVREGTAIVISPLISLMKDQVDNLANCGVEAGFLNSTQTPAERRTVREKYLAGELKLLYLAPERIRSEDGYRLLANGPVSFFAIDEAHCVSLWGHDFRPDYRELRSIREYCPHVAVHAYTATATEPVRDDIVEQLHLRDPQILVGSFDRPNLTYRVAARGKNRGLQQILDVLNRYPQESGIIYCLSRNEVERLSQELNTLGFPAAPYHAGMDDRARKRNQERFINDQARTIVATVAFGMGIDKSNVRYVVHAGVPASLENYQQESGRAGRDGLPSECVLLHSGADLMIWQRRIEDQPESLRENSRERLGKLIDYCETPICRHRMLVSYFGQELEGDCGGACDVCGGEHELITEPLVVAQKILSSVHRQGQRYGASYTAQVLMGCDDARVRQNGHESLSTFGLLKEHSEKVIVSWIGQLAGQGLLERQGEYNVLRITDQGRRLLKGEFEPRLTVAKKTGRAAKRAADEALEHPELFEELRQLRRSMAEARNVPPYVICSDATLKDMTRQRPSTVERLARVSGIGTHKQSTYGQMFVDCLLSWCEKHGVTMDAAPAKPTAGADTAAHEEAPKSRSAGSYHADALFEKGKSVAEVAAELKRAVSTVNGYLGEYLTTKKITDPSRWVDSRTQNTVEAAIAVVGARPLKVLFEHLQGAVTYDTLKVVVTCWENRR